METIAVTSSITMPLAPMRPRRGRKLKTKCDVQALLQRIEAGHWLVQPKLTGERALLAVVDGQVYVQDGQARWYQKPVANALSFLKLPNQTLLDGEIKDGKFYPFECLASLGESYMFKPAAEREVLAFQFVKFLGQRWMFATPTERFIKARGRNGPDWEGVILKEYRSIYVAGVSSSWIAKEWA